MDWTWAITSIGFIGVVLNARQKVSCFYWWIVSNILWIYVNIQTGMYAQAAMFFLYLGMCIYGIVVWKRKEKE